MTPHFLVVKITNQNPQSTKITTFALKISSATVTCTSAEKETMKAQVTSMESAIASVATVLSAIQEQIESRNSPECLLIFQTDILLKNIGLKIFTKTLFIVKLPLQSKKH